MSEDRFDQEPKEEDVEAHGFYPKDIPASGDPGDDSDDDFELHKKKAGLLDELNESGDKGDDFELHKKKAGRVDDESDDKGDDFELHKKKAGRVDDESDDTGDDFELHRRKA